MKKQNLHLRLAGSAILTGIATYLVVKATIMPLLQFVPFIIFALVLLVFFSKHIRKHHQRWSDVFTTLVMTWLLVMASVFLLFYTLPVEGMEPQAWTLTETTILISVNAAFALTVGWVLAGIIYFPMKGTLGQTTEKVGN